MTSSLDIAFVMAEEGRLAVWDSLLVESQSAGRGQLRRDWISPSGNLYATLRLPVSPPFEASAASVATGALFAKALCELGWPVLLKWPNDLVLTRDGTARKFGGILLEERRGVLLAGVGINIVNAPEASVLRKDAAVPATSLGEFADSPPEAKNLWQQLVKCVYSMYAEGDPFSGSWKNEAERLLLWKDCQVALIEGRTILRGRLTGLNPAGSVCLSMDGEMREFSGGALHLQHAI